MEAGKISGNRLKRSVLKQLRYRREEVAGGAYTGADCAVLALPEGKRTAVCVQEAIPERPGEIGLLIGRAANSLAASGASPVAVMLGITLPVEAQEAELRELMIQAEQAAAGLKLQIAGGHSAVSDDVTKPVVSVTALGSAEGSLKGLSPGLELVASKWIGLEGTALLARRFRESLLERYPAYLVEEAEGFVKYQSVLPEAAVALRAGVCDMHDASEGGILAALWEFAERTGVGLDVDMRRLPVRQETVEVCESIGVNPYGLLSGGCLLMAAKDGDGLVRALEEAGIPAVKIGWVTEGPARVLRNGEEMRYLERPKADEIYQAVQDGGRRGKA